MKPQTIIIVSIIAVALIVTVILITNKKQPVTRTISRTTGKEGLGKEVVRVGAGMLTGGMSEIGNVSQLLGK
jgi:hypothetical protein